mgnify:CR=1 FL=1
MAGEKPNAGGDPSPLWGGAGEGVARTRDVGGSIQPAISRDSPTPHPNPPPQGGRESDASLANARKLTPEAQRALAEAEERRKTAAEAARPKELGGRDGPEPVRYGDWENKGIAVDF